MKSTIKLMHILAAVLLLLNTNLASAQLLYQISNFPSDQDGAQLSGSITTNGTVGGFITEANILSWNFTVNKPGFSPYTVISTDANTEFNLFSSFDLFATSTELQLFGELQIGTNIGGIGGPTSTYVEWRATGANTSYLSALSGNVAAGGWETVNPVGFGSGPSWTIATVPEPSSFLLVAFAGAFAAFKRRRD